MTREEKLKWIETATGGQLLNQYERSYKAVYANGNPLASWEDLQESRWEYDALRAEILNRMEKPV